jgi:hypothetical protein
MSRESLKKMYLSVEWAIQDGTTMVVNDKRISIPTGWMLVWLGDVCHRGDAYDHVHTRIHAYLDPHGPAPNRAHFLHGCAVDV